MWATHSSLPLIIVCSLDLANATTSEVTTNTSVEIKCPVDQFKLSVIVRDQYCNQLQSNSQIKQLVVEVTNATTGEPISVAVAVWNPGNFTFDADLIYGSPGNFSVITKINNQPVANTPVYVIVKGMSLSLSLSLLALTCMLAIWGLVIHSPTCQCRFSIFVVGTTR